MQIKVLQWNVWYKESADRVLGVLKKIDADVVCLQELTHGYIEQSDENSWEYISHGLGFQYEFQEIPIISDGTQWLQANAIFSKYPIKSREALWLHEPLKNKEDSDQYRGYLEIKLDLNGKLITVATTHMSYGADPEDDREVQKLLEHVGSEPKKFILAGDINATPDSPRISKITKRLKNAGPPFNQNTWTTKPFNFGEFKASTLDWRYDYIFTSKDMKVSKSEIIKTDVSDHLPVLAVIDL